MFHTISNVSFYICA